MAYMSVISNHSYPVTKSCAAYCRGWILLNIGHPRDNQEFFIDMILGDTPAVSSTRFKFVKCYTHCSHPGLIIQRHSRNENISVNLRSRQG